MNRLTRHIAKALCCCCLVLASVSATAQLGNVVKLWQSLPLTGPLAEGGVEGGPHFGKGDRRPRLLRKERAHRRGVERVA